MANSSAQPTILGRTLITWCAYALFAGLIIGAFATGFAHGLSAARRPAAVEQALP